VQPLYRGASVALAVTLLSGCAIHQSRIPQQPSPPVNAAPPAAAPESLSDYMQKIRHLSVNARPLNKNEAVETLETRDPAIAAELLLVSSQPTAERYRILAERYRERGVLDAAYRNFNRAIALNPRDAAAYEGLARVWRDWGLPALALGDAHRATYYAPQSASARNTYGTVMQALGHHDHARAAYEAASRLEPQAAYAVNNLCYLAFVDGRLDTAIETCRKALEIDPTMTAARNNLALAFAAAGRIDLARAEFVRQMHLLSKQLGEKLQKGLESWYPAKCLKR
jgi:tetratricopeptide (TPR) repeat protein